MSAPRAPRLRNYTGHPFWSYGFRPFFFLGALYAGLSVLLWLPQIYGELQLSSLFAPVDWHIHEMFFGYLTAIIAGFLFTAIPNWTGRLPFRGVPLMLLILVWGSGRIAVTFSAYLGWLPTMFVDLSFLLAITLVVGREIICGKNWRNLKVLMPVGVMLIANAAFHLESHFSGTSEYSRRLALGAVLALVMIIGGRIIPSFTRNWLARYTEGPLPAPFGRFDIISMVLSVLALITWTIFGETIFVGGMFAIAAALQLVRLFRWVGVRAWREPLVGVLHISYLFLPVGFALLSMSSFWSDAIVPAAGIHALSVGAIGAMTLSVMVRVTLGHTGRPLKADWTMSVVFGGIFISTVTRIAAVFGGDVADTLLHVSAFTWALSFLAYAGLFAPMLMKARLPAQKASRKA